MFQKIKASLGKLGTKLPKLPKFPKKKKSKKATEKTNDMIMSGRDAINLLDKKVQKSTKNTKTIRDLLSIRGIKIAVIGVIVLGSILLVALFAPFFIERYEDWKNRRDSITIETIDLTIYYSRGSRDEERVEQYSFTKGDPIQTLMEFTDAESGTVLRYTLMKEGDEEKIKIQDVEIPVDDSGTRFITARNDLEPGTYVITISQAGYDLAEKTFEIE